MQRKGTGRKIGIALAILVVILLSSSYFSQTGTSTGNTQNTSPSHVLSSYGQVSFLGSLSNSSVNYTGDMQVVIAFNLSNQNELNLLLVNLSNPLSPQYHHFLTESQFNREFSPSAQVYSSAESYFSEFGLSVQQTFRNRLLLSVTGPANEMSLAFHTRLVSASSGSSYAPSTVPALPSWLSGSVSSVIGLDSASNSLDLNMAAVSQYSPNATAVAPSATASQYPSIQYKNGIQLLYGSYMQKAYNETPLFSKTYSTGEVIATLLWTGSYSSNGNTVYTAPYNPADLSNYFNQTLPSGQPHPSIYGVPVNGAPLPGVSAGKDTSGAVFENTLDLEMAGSTAPGASIYNVYGQNSTLADLTLAFNTVLNPPSADPGLKNVSVISNSWGATDMSNSTWNNLLEESQARGITVLASTGDSGDNFSSSKSVSSNEYVQFPSTVGYDTYGVVAVGGTNVSLYQNLTIKSQQAWYLPHTSNGDTLGTVGGISSIYPEPTWQSISQADSVIQANGNGRAVPDVAAVANNTLIYVSNTTYTGYLILSGTSVSAPIVAGIVAEINAYRATENQSTVGFMDPSIYMLGTQQYDPALAGGIAPQLPPFYDVTLGENYAYSALVGYDLVTGMGSINAYNFMADMVGKKYNVSFQQTGLPSSTRWSVNIEGHAYNSSGTYVNLSLANGTYYYEVPLVGDMVSVPVGGELTVHGTPVEILLQFRKGYPVNFNQNGLPAGKEWLIKVWNYTESTSGPNVSLYFPNGTFNYTVKSMDLNYYGSSGNFTVNGSPLSLSVNFTHGIFNVTFRETGLPLNRLWSVSNGTVLLNSTNDTLTFTLPGGEYTFTVLPAGRYVTNRTSITLNTNGQNRTVYLGFGYGYFITFNASGVPSGESWTLLIADYNESTTNTSQTVELQNGTYLFHAYVENGGITEHLSSNVTVSGANVTVNLSFGQVRSSLDYYVLYIALALMGMIVLIIGVLMLRRK